MQCVPILLNYFSESRVVLFLRAAVQLPGMSTRGVEPATCKTASCQGSSRLHTLLGYVQMKADAEIQQLPDHGLHLASLECGRGAEISVYLFREL